MKNREAITKPKSVNPSAYFFKYIKCAPKEDLLVSLEASKIEFLEAISRVQQDKENYQYAEDKWTIKQLVRHISDCERIFIYRALSISRKDTTPLLSFSEDHYAANDDTENLSLNELKEEFETVRNSSIQFFKLINSTVLDTEGEASKLKVTPRMIGWIISGHCQHHCTILKERYL